MDVPQLCLHKEEQSRLVDEHPPWQVPWTYQGFFVDWQPWENVHPYNLGLLALEAHILYDAVTDSQSDDEVERNWAHGGQNVVIIYHTPVKQRRPHHFLMRNSPDDWRSHERLSRECRWQEGAAFDPGYYNNIRKSGHWSASPCWEGRIRSRYSKRLLAAYLDKGDQGVFDYLSRLWSSIFESQYHHYVSLTGETS